MAILGVDDFKSKLTGGGARANLFKATVNFPSYVNPDMELTSFLCKGVQVPSSTIAPIAIPFRGRQLQMAGDRTFEPLSLTIINDSDFQVRNAFESWANGINNFATNTGLANMNDYISDVVVEQLNKAGEVTKKYDFRGCWPSSISTIDLNYDSENTIEEFTVELQVKYWESNTTA